MRRVIHLVERGATPLKCIRCSAICPVIKTKDIHRAPVVCFNEKDWNSLYVDNKDYRRCTDPFDPPTPVFPAPKSPGYYWAEWRQAEKRTNPGQDATPSFVEEIVEVVRVITPERNGPLKVYLFGVSIAQPLDFFVWRSGRLRPITKGEGGDDDT